MTYYWLSSQILLLLNINYLTKSSLWELKKLQLYVILRNDFKCNLKAQDCVES